VTRALALGPRSIEAVRAGVSAMVALRRYDEARELVAHAQALEPGAPLVISLAVELASAVGDTAGVSAGMRSLRAAGVARSTVLLDKMRLGDAALQQELATLSLASLRAATARDSMGYYRTKAQLFLARGEAAPARAIMDSGFRVSASYATEFATDSVDAALLSRRAAWFAAGRGDRQAAMAALRQGAGDPAIRGRPGNLRDADQTCTSAEVYGLLGDVEAMLPLLRRCLTMLNGYHLAQLGQQPAFARVRADPRVRALAAELAAAQPRARSASVHAAP
jgi:hypothetical protein